MTVRHYMGTPRGSSNYTLHEAIENEWVIPAICGELYQPSDPILNHPSIDVCGTCHAAQHRPGSLRPHYVYRCYDEADRLIYVGCTVTPPLRMQSHKMTSWWWPQVSYVRNLVFSDRDTALAKERQAIQREMPLCNVKGRWLKDDPRVLWSAQDYLDFRRAIVQAVETTHGVYGTLTRSLLAQVDAELAERHGVVALEVTA